MKDRKAGFGRIAIVGVGLIGGSLALALKAAGAVEEVVGVGRDPVSLEIALSHGLIDRSSDLAGALAGCDLVVLATPVGQMGRIMQAMHDHLEPQTLITDAGSTKQDVVALMRHHLAGHLANCVPAHPIAGAELCGPLAARADLYQGKNVVLTPLPETTSDAARRVGALWQLCGGIVCQMDAVRHDATFAAVSHLPHVLAYALVDMIAGRDNRQELFGFAASGFRDFTRIAGSSPEMWRDIALANREALLGEMDAYLARLAVLREQLAAADGEALMQAFSRARTAREAWLTGQSIP